MAERARDGIIPGGWSLAGVEVAVRAEVMSAQRLPMDGRTTIFAIYRKKPLISKAGTFDGLYDGIQKSRKYLLNEFSRLICELIIDGNDLMLARCYGIRSVPSRVTGTVPMVAGSRCSGATLAMTTAQAPPDRFMSIPGSGNAAATRPATSASWPSS